MFAVIASPFGCIAGDSSRLPRFPPCRNSSPLQLSSLIPVKGLREALRHRHGQGARDVKHMMKRSGPSVVLEKLIDLEEKLKESVQEKEAELLAEKGALQRAEEKLRGMMDGKVCDTTECTHPRLPLYITNAMVGATFRIVSLRRQRDALKSQIVLRGYSLRGGGDADRAHREHGELRDESDVKQAVRAVKAAI